MAWFRRREETGLAGLPAEGPPPPAASAPTLPPMPDGEAITVVVTDAGPKPRRLGGQLTQLGASVRFDPA